MSELNEEELHARLHSLGTGVRAGLRHFKDMMQEAIEEIEAELPNEMVVSEPWRWKCSECDSGMIKKGAHDLWVHICTTQGVSE